jgi:hypothetical protein
MREQYPLGSRQNMMSFSLSANLEKCFRGLLHQVSYLEAFLAGGFKELLGNL